MAKLEGEALTTAKKVKVRKGAMTIGKTSREKAIIQDVIQDDQCLEHGILFKGISNDKKTKLHLDSIRGSVSSWVTISGDTIKPNGEGIKEKCENFIAFLSTYAFGTNNNNGFQNQRGQEMKYKPSDNGKKSHLIFKTGTPGTFAGKLGFHKFRGIWTGLHQKLKTWEANVKEAEAIKDAELKEQEAELKNKNAALKARVDAAAAKAIRKGYGEAISTVTKGVKEAMKTCKTAIGTAIETAKTNMDNLLKDGNFTALPEDAKKSLTEYVGHKKDKLNRILPFIDKKTTDDKNADKAEDAAQEAVENPENDAATTN